MKPPFWPGQTMWPLFSIHSGKTTDDSGERLLGFKAPTAAAMLGQSFPPAGTFSAFDSGS